MTKRKDSKGRILKTGESQRKDGIYMYRYSDIRGKRKTIYSNDLKELRERESLIQRDSFDGIDYDAGDISAIKLIEQALGLKVGLCETTMENYQTVFKILQGYDIFYHPVKSIKKSDAKNWIIQLYREGKKSSTIGRYLSVVSFAFDQACEDDLIRKNPFKISAKEYAADDKFSAVALTEEQQISFLSFVRDDPIFCKQYDAYNILLGTGLRISEFIGLTVHDLDMQNRIIHVTHQLTLARDRTFHVTKPKSWHSIRDIYMSDSVYHSFQHLVEEAKNRKVKIMIDGYCDFLQVSREGTIRGRRNFNMSLTSAVKKYNRLHPDTPLPRITPHTFRHTFCTNMANRGIDIKSLQYPMGHSNVAITLNVYTHANANTAVQQMARLVEFTPTGSSAVPHVG